MERMIDDQKKDFYCLIEEIKNDLIKLQEKYAKNKVRERQDQAFKEKDMLAGPLLNDDGVDDDQYRDELIGEPVMTERACPIAIQVCDQPPDDVSGPIQMRFNPYSLLHQLLTL